MSAAAPPFAGLDDLIDGAARERGLLPPVAPPAPAPAMLAPSPPTPPPLSAPSWPGAGPSPSAGGPGQQPRDPLDDLIDGASAERAHARASGIDPASGYELQQIKNIEPESWFMRNISRPAAEAFTGAVHATQAHLGLPVGRSPFDTARGGAAADPFIAAGAAQEGIPAEASRTVGGLAGSALDPATVAGMAVAGPAGRAVGAEAAPAIAALVESIGARAGPAVAAAASRVLASVTGGAGGGAAFGGTQKASEIALSDPGRFLSDPEGVRDEILAAGGAGAKIGAGFGAAHGVAHGAGAAIGERGGADVKAAAAPATESKGNAAGLSIPPATDRGTIRLTDAPDLDALMADPAVQAEAKAKAAAWWRDHGPASVQTQNRVEPQPSPPGEQPRPVAPAPQEEGASAAGAGDVAVDRAGVDAGQGSPPGSTVAQERVNASENAQTGPLHERVRQEPRGDEGQVPGPEGRPGVPEAGGAGGGVREPGAAEEAVAPPPPIPTSPALRAMLLPPLRELARAHGLDDAGGKGAVVDRLIAKRGELARGEKAAMSAGVQPPEDRGAAGVAAGPPKSAEGATEAQRPQAGANPEQVREHGSPPESRNDTLPAQGAPREAGTAAQRNGPDRLGDGSADPRAPAPGRGGEQPGGAAADGQPDGAADPGGTRTTGIAHRVTESRGTAAERGEGIGAEESVARGRELLRKGADPEEVLARFEKTHAVSGEDMAVARAHLETLSRAANAAHDAHGAGSPEYKAAFRAESDWIARAKPMQTEWHKIGQAQQGETEIDAGTFHGLQRAYHGISGKEFTPVQEAKARGTAAKVKEATAAAEAARARLYTVLDADQSPRVKTLAERIGAKLDQAANNARARIKARGVRLHAGIDPAEVADYAIIGADYIAKGTAKFAEWSGKMLAEFGEGIRPHLKAIFEASDKALDSHIAGESSAKKAPALRKELAAKAAAPKAPAADIAGHTPGTRMSTPRARALWEDAKKSYLEKGVSDFGTIVNGLAADHGLPVADIRRGLAQPKGARELTNEMYAKQAERRRVVEDAKAWVRAAGTSRVLRAAKGTPGLMFSLKTLGHSTVGMITHAGPVLAGAVPGGPRFRAYFRNFAEQYRFVADAAYNEMAKEDLRGRPNYVTAQRAGLANSVEKAQDEYQSAAQNLLGKLGLPAGARGFDALKFMRQDLFDLSWDKLPASLKTPEMAEDIARAANHLTGYGENIAGRGKLGKAASVALFAPKLEGSRWGLLLGDPALAVKRFANWANESPSARAAAVAQVKQAATMAGVYLTYLTANQALLSATGSAQKVNFTDPSKADWLSFKAGGYNLGIVGPLLGSVRFLIDLARIPTESRKELHGGEPLGEAGKRAAKYLRGKLSPFGQPLADAYTGADHEGRPIPGLGKTPPKYLVQRDLDDRYTPSQQRNLTRAQEHELGRQTLPEYLAKTLLPIPISEALQEAWHGQGMSRGDIERWGRAILVGAVSGATGARLHEDAPKK